MARIIIIGNGIAGSTAARYIRKNSDHEITMISGETDYPFSRTALMYIYMGHMKFEHTKLYEDWFWAKNRIKNIKAWVKEIDTISKSILLENGEIISYDKLILATGSRSNKFGWPGQDLNGVQGLYHLQDLENMETATQQGLTRAVIVGGGLIGIEMAEMFHSRHIPVTFLVREDGFWNAVLPAEESEMTLADRDAKRARVRHLAAEFGFRSSISTMEELADEGDSSRVALISVQVDGGAIASGATLITQLARPFRLVRAALDVQGRKQKEGHPKHKSANLEWITDSNTLGDWFNVLLAGLRSGELPSKDDANLVRDLLGEQYLAEKQRRT